MARRKRASKLSSGEFRLMAILWEQGPLTLAEAYERQHGQLAYTTIQTQLNRLVGKGMASRTKTRPMKYRALVEPREAGETLLQLLIETVGGGSIIPLVSQLVRQATLTHDDARKLKEIIDAATPKRMPAKKSRANRSRKDS